jgi:hypothetical protein
MEVTRDEFGRYVAQLYLSKLEDGATASVLPKVGYKPTNIAFELIGNFDVKFVQATSWIISKLDGGWRLLDGLIAAAGKPAKYTSQIKNHWGNVLYEKPTNQIPQQVKDNYQAVKGEFASEFSLVPPDPADQPESDNYPGSTSFKGKGDEYLAAKERFEQNSVGRGGKRRNKTNKKNKKKKQRKTKRRRSRKHL